VDVGHLNHYRSYSEALEEHFDFSGDCGGEVYAASFGEMTQDGDINFSENNNGSESPLNYGKDIRVKLEKRGSTDNRETNERAADKYFVGEGVDHSAELAGDTEATCDSAVDHIGQAGDYEQDEGDIEEPPLLLRFEFRRPQNHCQDYDRKDKTATGKNIRQLI
jgi:hypothetical protein